MPVPSKESRLAEVFRRLEGMPASGSFEEAWLNLEKTLDAVEDELSGAPQDPSRWQSDGRMYMPQADSEIKAPRKGVRKFRSRGHYVLFGPNGAIEVQDLRGRTVHARSGADGQGVTS
jgi:hypothetical protein